jgi:hypothetical protein
MDDRQIFTETEAAHAARLYGTRMGGRLPPGARRQTKMRRWALRLRRQAHTKDIEIKAILGTNGTWEVASASMSELERWLEVIWDKGQQRYVPYPERTRHTTE